jgi:ferritin
MLKLVKCINECGGKALILALKKQPQNFESVHTFFEEILKHEILVSTEINNLVDICLKEKDYTTHNFLQWYVAEQIEEEALSRRVLDKLKFIGNDKSGLYFFDRDLGGMSGGQVPIQK